MKQIVFVLILYLDYIYSSTFYKTIQIPYSIELKDIGMYKNNSEYTSKFIKKDGEVVFVADTLDGVNAYYNAKNDGHGDGDYSFYQCTEYVGRYYQNYYKKYLIYTGYKQKIDLKSHYNQGFIGSQNYNGIHINYGGIPSIYVGQQVAFSLVNYPKNINKSFLYKKDNGLGHVAIVKNKVKEVYLKYSNKEKKYFYSISKKKNYDKYYQVNLIEENKLPYKSCSNGCNIPKRAIFIKESYSKTGYFSVLYTENISDLNNEKLILKKETGIRFFKPPSFQSVSKKAIDKMLFIQDITIKENGKDNLLKNYTSFIKVWKIKNIGYKVWTKDSYLLTTSNNAYKKQKLFKEVIPNKSILIGMRFNANYKKGKKQKYNIYLYNNKIVSNGYVNTTFYVDSKNCLIDNSCRHYSYKKYQDLLYPKLTKTEANKLILKYLNVDISKSSPYNNIKNNKVLTRFYAAALLFEAAVKKNKAKVDERVYGIQISEDGITFNKDILTNIEDLIYANQIKKNISKANAENYTYAQKFALGAMIFPIKRKDDKFYWTKEMRYRDFENSLKLLKEDLK